MGNLQIHHLKPAEGSRKDKTRVGRGDASKGKTAGRGTKGSKARGSIRAGFEGGQMPLQMRLPKLDGFKNPNKVVYQVINLDTLKKFFPKGGKINQDVLVKANVVRKNQKIKVLGTGSIDTAYEISVDKISKSAQKEIEKNKGTFSETPSVIKKASKVEVKK